ncbi:MAG: ELM1/GtrOC1 family putative glycosyltransferase [Desulfopila sp.]|jgi:mitochondrial fission protein ELM1|nr:ELM1/GtrOC1 family putative glycosyltransferase [Desulfopila sp.]
MTGKTPLKIGVFLDGRPGHEKQTMGIVDRLRKKNVVDVTTIRVTKKGIFRQIADWLLYFSFFKRVPERKLRGCNLLIGTGTHVHLPMLHVKKYYHIPVITCMTPSSLLQKKIDLIFSPQHDGLHEQDNVFLTVGPPNSNVDMGEHLENHVLVLCGGIDSKSHVWRDDAIINGIIAIIERDPSKQYILSSSPRTPVETSKKLKAVAEELDNVDFFDFLDTPSGWVERRYNECRQVWVTADSISMVYEALSSGCQVGIIPVAWLGGRSKFMRSEKFLRESGFTLELKDYLHGKDFPKTKKTLNEAERCADEILRRFV